MARLNPPPDALARAPADLKVRGYGRGGCAMAARHRSAATPDIPAGLTQTGNATPNLRIPGNGSLESAAGRTRTGTPRT
jgi:hypothetical protein